MNPLLILQPVAALFLLTGLVWFFMYARRLAYLTRHGIDPQALVTPEQLNATLPANINSASNNLKNLFELPVLFYALCGLLFAMQKVDAAFLYAAWAFVALRAVHSFIHCTVNIVKFRFAAYLLSSMALWFMVARFIWLVS
ncbi:MAG: MAPEG family protein [Brachymonas sp.]|nr:MAPEG family protein [Brachymonas sp.]